jgi:hypothetical protein
MKHQPDRPPSPVRVAAGRANRRRRGPLTAAGRARLRAAALRHQPWLSATGPVTSAGKAQAARNGKRRQLGSRSVRELRADVRAARQLVQAMRETAARLASPEKA